MTLWLAKKFISIQTWRSLIQAELDNRLEHPKRDIFDRAIQGLYGDNKAHLLDWIKRKNQMNNGIQNIDEGDNEGSIMDAGFGSEIKLE